MDRRLTAGLLALLLLVAAAACWRQRAQPRPAVVVGVGSTTEQQLLAALTAVSLDRAGFEPRLRTGLAGTVGLRREAIGGNVDAYWDYTGSAWGLGMGRPAPPADPDESYQRVLAEDRSQGLQWLQPSGANATLALFVRPADVTDPAQRRLSALDELLDIGHRRLCLDPDFVDRSGGLDALVAAYELDPRRISGLVVRAGEVAAIRRTAAGQCFAALATATSGEAVHAGLVRLVDDREVFPAFVVAPVVRSLRMEEVPGLRQALERVAHGLDTEILGRLNARVAAGQQPSRVAGEYLSEALGRRR